MSEKICLSVNFDQVQVSDEVIDLLSKNLKETLARDTLKVTLSESLTLAAKGTKLQNGPANDLLFCILRALSVVSPEPEESDDSEEESDPEEEPGDEGEEDADDVGIDDDESLSQMLKAARKKSTKAGAKKDKPVTQASKIQKLAPNQNENQHKTKDKELCRFYARGQCTRRQDCRFDHPNICKKFRQFGSNTNDKKGCDGKCAAFHPNACRNSVRNRTCSWKDCKFFHLKGTKRTVRDTNQPQTKNWPGQQNPNQINTGNQNPNNWSGNWNEKMNQIRNSYQNSNNSSNSNNNNNFNSSNQNGSGAINKQVFQQDQPELAMTLQEIMRRLSAMEARQAALPIHTQMIAPNLSPTVPQPGTQTQRQWGSPNPWTQSQC